MDLIPMLNSAHFSSSFQKPPQVEALQQMKRGECKHIVFRPQLNKILSDWSNFSVNLALIRRLD